MLGTPLSKSLTMMTSKGFCINTKAMILEEEINKNEEVMSLITSLIWAVLWSSDLPPEGFGAM